MAHQPRFRTRTVAGRTPRRPFAPRPSTFSNTTARSTGNGTWRISGGSPSRRSSPRPPGVAGPWSLARSGAFPSRHQQMPHDVHFAGPNRKARMKEAVQGNDGSCSSLLWAHRLRTCRFRSSARSQGGPAWAEILAEPPTRGGGQEDWRISLSLVPRKSGKTG